MAGIYIHIPFCHRRCHYCDFYTHVNISYLSPFFDALLTEIELRANFFSEKTVIETVYFGGGTPSILHSSAIATILEKLSKFFDLHDYCEITLEVNPEDVSEEYYRQIKKVGVNRLSIGTQSFNNKILHYLNRRHGAEHSVQSIEWAFNVGIENISIDLIYGIPIMDNNLWESTIRTAVKFPVKHISAYHLTIEPRTTFGFLKEKGKLQEINENQCWQQMEILHNLLEDEGFEHYEISNFARQGYRSRHNQSYWKSVPYLGLGPSAHSFDGRCRYENIRDLQKYISAINERKLAITADILTQVDQMNEVIMLELRCKEGLSKNRFLEKFGNERYIEIEQKAKKFYPQYLEINDRGIVLNLEGWFISDRIAAELFFG